MHVSLPDHFTAKQHAKNRQNAREIKQTEKSVSLVLPAALFGSSLLQSWRS